MAVYKSFVDAVGLHILPVPLHHCPGQCNRFQNLMLDYRSWVSPDQSPLPLQCHYMSDELAEVWMS